MHCRVAPDLHCANYHLPRLFVHLDDLLLLDDLRLVQGSGLTVFLVNAAMSLEGKPIGKRCRTDVTFEWFQAGVDLFVIF